MEASRIAVIGTGFLMSYLDPCVKLLAGPNFSENIVGISQSLATAQRKSEELGYPVTPQGHLPTLQRFLPDVIMFSPPPSAAKHLTQTVLAPYFEWSRFRNIPLPDLYVFPPNPSAGYYRDALGDGANVVTLLPNMAATVGGYHIAAQSYSVTIFPAGARWPRANRERLSRFLTPIGSLLEVPEEHSTNMLGGFVASHMVQEFTLSLSAGLAQSGLDLPPAQAAGVMRHHLLERYDRRFPGGVPCGDCPSPALSVVLGASLEAWQKGMTEFSLSRGMSRELTDAVCVPQLNIFLQSAQCSSPEEIDYNNRCHATQGGLLERGLEVFAQEGRPRITSLFSGGLDAIGPGALGAIAQVSYRLSREIWQRGESLAAN